ncbi:MAG: FAD-dependent oxidoreductase [Acidimicrobiales bacterium]
MQVVVLGSGAAGLAAALSAASEGADVVVVERADAVGGTTALSGGVVWAPGNRLATTGDADRDGARRYLLALATGDVDAALVDSFLTHADDVVHALAEASALEWEPLPHWPDYRGEFDGASEGGRSLWPRPIRLAGPVAARVQPDPAAGPWPGTGPAAKDETTAPTGTAPTDAEVLRGPVRGRALVGALLAAALDLGVEFRTSTRARELVAGESGVTGVRIGDGSMVEGRVVLATGGFQFDAALRAAFLSGAPVAPMGTPGCSGDGLHMAQSAGAALGNMSEGWWMPAMHVPGEELGGAPFFRALHGERAQAGAFLVDRHGRRFVDEAQNYGDVGRAMRRFATGPEPYPAAPCWLVFDGLYRATFPIGPLRPLEPGDEDPPWLVRAPTPAALAEAMGVPTRSLADTVERFNALARAGRDDDFGRGTQPYDRWIGGDTLGTLDEPPYYALVVHAGCMGTKGGPRTDGAGRVLSAASAGAVIRGLYAAGNVAASPFGTATAAGGATLGPALTFGWLAGRSAALDT